MAVLFSYVGQQSFVLTRLPSWLKTRVKIVLASFLFHTHFLFFWPLTLLTPYVFYMNCGVCWCIIHSPPALDDHKPTVGTRGPRRPNHKHVWIYLANLEFISRSLPRPVFLLDGERDVLSQVPSEIVGSLWRAVGFKVVHFFSHPRLSSPEPAWCQLASAGMDVCH